MKAGLAAGVIYGVMIGLSHVGYLEACRTTQLSFIAQRILQLNATSTQSASDIFVQDLVQIPISWGVGALILGVIYGAVYSLVYPRIPGSTSRRKGLTTGVIVFVLSYAFGISGFEIACSPNYFPYIALAISLPISLVYGYVLGIFYDAFGRLAEEKARQIEEEKKAKTGRA